jgi:hypothetical protein
MRKQIIIIAVVVLILIVGLSGCLSDKNKFVGQWEMQGMIVFTFREGGTYTSTVTSGTYEVKDGKLICKATNINLVLSYYYTFADNDNILILNGIGGADSGTLRRKT